MHGPNAEIRTGARIGAAIECGIWLVIAAGMWAYSYAFDREISTYALGPVSWPRAIIVIIVIVAIGAYLSDLRQAGAGGAAAQVGEGDREDKLDRAAMVRLAAAMITPLIYVWLLPRTGYFATTPFFIAAYMYILGVTSVRSIVVTTLVSYAVLLLFFTKLLYVPLPTGNWPGFYDFSNWLLVLLK